MISLDQAVIYPILNNQSKYVIITRRQRDFRQIDTEVGGGGWWYEFANTDTALALIFKWSIARACQYYCYSALEEGKQKTILKSVSI